MFAGCGSVEGLVAMGWTSEKFNAESWASKALIANCVTINIGEATSVNRLLILSSAKIPEFSPWGLNWILCFLSGYRADYCNARD